MTFRDRRLLLRLPVNGVNVRKPSLSLALVGHGEVLPLPFVPYKPLVDLLFERPVLKSQILVVIICNQEGLVVDCILHHLANNR